MTAMPMMPMLEAKGGQERCAPFLVRMLLNERFSAVRKRILVFFSGGSRPAWAAPGAGVCRR